MYKRTYKLGARWRHERYTYIYGSITCAFVCWWFFFDCTNRNCVLWIVINFCVAFAANLYSLVFIFILGIYAQVYQTTSFIAFYELHFQVQETVLNRAPREGKLGPDSIDQIFIRFDLDGLWRGENQGEHYSKCHRLGCVARRLSPLWRRIWWKISRPWAIPVGTGTSSERCSTKAGERHPGGTWPGFLKRSSTDARAWWRIEITPITCDELGKTEKLRQWDLNNLL